MQQRRRDAGERPDWSDPDQVAQQVWIAKTLFEARRISLSQYVFFASSPVEQLHESRIMDKYYPDLNALLDHPVDTYAPDDNVDPHRVAEQDSDELDELFSIRSNRHLVELLRNFSLADLADLFEMDREEFDRHRERGRRAVHHSKEFAAALKDVVLRYESDARRAAEAGAYSAAVTLLGAGLEGVLLLRCLKSRTKAQRIAKSLPKSQRPRHIDDPLSWSFDTLIAVCETCNWLPTFEAETRYFRTAGLAHAIRLMRNNVHPGRQIRESPWSETTERDYADAEGIYVLLLSVLDSWPREFWRRGRGSTPQPDSMH